jgi:uncharacterized protein (DUF433 family)
VWLSIRVKDTGDPPPVLGGARIGSARLRGKEEPIVVDPDYGFGLPVVSGSGARTEIVAERFMAGDAREVIAYDFGLSTAEVEAALRYEMPNAA